MKNLFINKKPNLSENKTNAKVTLENVNVNFPILNADKKSIRSNLIYLGTGGNVKPDAGSRLSVEALRSINITASSGDRIGLIGRNGAGKSTLLRLIGGIYYPTSGNINVTG